MPPSGHRRPARWSNCPWQISPLWLPWIPRSSPSILGLIRAGPTFTWSTSAKGITERRSKCMAQHCTQEAGGRCGERSGLLPDRSGDRAAVRSAFVRSCHEQFRHAPPDEFTRHVPAQRRFGVLRSGGAFCLLDFGPPRGRLGRAVAHLMHGLAELADNFDGRLPGMLALFVGVLTLSSQPRELRKRSLFCERARLWRRYAHRRGESTLTDSACGRVRYRSTASRPVA